MKVEIAKLDGSFGPITIEMTAEDERDRSAMSMVSKIPFSARFRLCRVCGEASDGTLSKIVLEEEEYKDDPNG